MKTSYPQEIDQMLLVTDDEMRKNVDVAWKRFQDALGGSKMTGPPDRPDFKKKKSKSKAAKASRKKNR